MNLCKCVLTDKHVYATWNHKMHLILEIKKWTLNLKSTYALEAWNPNLHFHFEIVEAHLKLEINKYTWNLNSTIALTILNPRMHPNLKSISAPETWNLKMCLGLEIQKCTWNLKPKYAPEAWIHNIYIYICTHINIFEYTCIQRHIYVYIYTQKKVSMYVHINIYSLQSFTICTKI